MRCYSPALPKLFSPVKLPFKLILGIIFGWILGACGSTSETRTPAGYTNTGPRIENSFQIQGQQLPPVTIRSIELFRGSVGQAPIIRLNSAETLTLRFDELSSELNPFRVTLSHHNADWSLSNLLPNLYMPGFQEDYLQSGNPGRFQNPAFVSYSYSFPNTNLRISRSGNYMLHVYRMDSGAYLFSQPFLVVENEGTLHAEIEELFNQDARYLRHHQLFARYLYEGVEIVPQVDYQVFFVQNQFWSRARKANQSDFSQDGVARMYLSRDRAFVGTFDYLQLNLNRIDNYSMQIIDFRQDLRIPRITLNRDVVNLSISPSLRNLQAGAGPSNRNDARYALVRFQLEVPPGDRPPGDIYIVGGFNNWALHPLQRMSFDPTSGYLTGEAVVKEGQYAYKYVSLDGNRINDMYFDASFASTSQEYHTLVYKRDQTFQIDRLVAVHRLTSP
jgi:hypothetical protein